MCAASRSQISIMGDLQRVLGKGEYAPFTSAPMFESNFVQVNRRGEPIYVHNRPNCVTVGICASSPSLSLPNVMLLAHTVPTFSQEDVSKPWKASKQPSSMEQLVLSRFFPLKFVEITVHNAEKRRLKLKLASGRSFYLELCAPPDNQCLLFRQWLRLISLLKLPQDHYNTQVNVVYENFNGQQAERMQGTRNQSDKRDTHLETLNSIDILESENEEVAKRASSKRVTISGIVGPIEECGSSKRGLAVASRSSIIKETKRDPSMQSEKQQRKDHPEVKKSKSTEKKKSRENVAEYKTENNLQASGMNYMFLYLFPLHPHKQCSYTISYNVCAQERLKLEYLRVPTARISTP
ncbi:family with sequence similarity 71 member D [Chelydra serpentina]|uniref:Family with sequence similarity 71 member D n=1 Tax=Chelydra serpentina TaxID=8475 RepID=A0A8T1SPN0_CHESE|nr:family with sequence similarity 71 member D [Chelydra serpentina]